ncbi:hypothetical protein AGLY_004135 [Aphis glycines]|uniref:Uncharacterized protein n=1 Tax=Aphis glycines TaxID=307491 RepID=A0A6G0TYK2_APHGL|nr:hypothetical protein AGLY_004135 [Aphis glycines]
MQADLSSTQDVPRKKFTAIVYSTDYRIHSDKKQSFKIIFQTVLALPSRNFFYGLTNFVVTMGTIATEEFDLMKDSKYRIVNCMSHLNFYQCTPILICRFKALSKYKFQNLIKLQSIVLFRGGRLQSSDNVNKYFNILSLNNMENCYNLLWRGVSGRKLDLVKNQKFYIIYLPFTRHATFWGTGSISHVKVSKMIHRSIPTMFISYGSCGKPVSNFSHYKNVILGVS